MTRARGEMPTKTDATPGQDNMPDQNQSPQRMRSDELLRGKRRLIIQHGNEDYCLQVTRNNRLILTKI